MFRYIFFSFKGNIYMYVYMSSCTISFFASKKMPLKQFFFLHVCVYELLRSARSAGFLK
jgi:hypothetical protein